MHVYSVRFEGVTKRYPASDHDALSDLRLTIDAEEFVSLVGPSGCGKSTALRILAGLEHPSRGRIQLGGVDITDLETRRRHVGLVTQQNQLLNHMTARRNIQFPLEVRPSPGPLGRALPEDRRRSGKLLERVSEEADHFGITDLLDRRPRTLSEGQRRLVQLVRAVVASPSTLLMDEPLGYLEDQIRIKLRSEILRVHRSRRLTSVMATASQHDAMVMSDRIAVLLDGELAQVDTPAEIYDHPATATIAGFFGEPAMNLLPAVVGADRHVEVLGRSRRMWPPVLDRYRGLPIVVGVRPEDIEVGVPQDEGFACEVRRIEVVGHHSAVFTVAPSGVRIAYSVAGAPPRVGTVVDLGFRSDRAHLFDAVSGLALHHPAR